ncbi:cyclase family protein [Leucobacter sp. NPDC077196]|uniref:cyclase family protein n=1 Tax=Leucobacter sp. NPDC077196 TaxID=3154959 RepID=UPI0034139472
MTVVDLSHPIVSGMPVYPGDPEVLIAPALTVDADGVAVARLDMGSHTGTHLDAPAHSVVGGRTVDEIPLELLTGAARVLRVGPAPAVAGESITAERLAAAIPDHLPPIVCIATGWDVHFGGDAAHAHPSISLDLARLLWARGARVLGVDCFSPDATEVAGEGVGAGAGMPVHEFWLGNDGVIVENLARLAELPEAVEMSLLPLRVDQADGSPIRAVAFTE